MYSTYTIEYIVYSLIFSFVVKQAYDLLLVSESSLNFKKKKNEKILTHIDTVSILINFLKRIKKYLNRIDG